MVRRCSPSWSPWSLVKITTVSRSRPDSPQRVEHNADLPVHVGHEVAVERRGRGATAARSRTARCARSGGSGPAPRSTHAPSVPSRKRSDPARLGAGRREVLGQRRTLFQRCRLEGGAVGVAGQHPADVVRIDERGPQEERPAVRAPARGPAARRKSRLRSASSSRESPVRQ